jgi:hypothetical protein
MKRTLAWLVLVSWATCADAQDDVTVAGRAVDAANGAPVAYATVTVLRDGTAVGGELADEAGKSVGPARGTRQR